MFYEWTRIVRGWGARLVRRRLRLCAAPGARAAVDPRAGRARPGAAAVGLHRHLVDRHRRLFRRPRASASASSRRRSARARPSKGCTAALPRRPCSAAPGRWPRASACRCSLLAPLFAVAAQGGDLFESGMKRRAGVKDFGQLAAGPWRRARPARRAGAGGCADRAGAASGADVTRKIAILGATGSIGKSTLDLVERSPDRFEVVAVTAATNVEALADDRPADRREAGRHRRREPAAPSLQRAAGRHRLPRRGGRGGADRSRRGRGRAGHRRDRRLRRPASRPWPRSKPGRTVALANKEALVTAGELMTDAADAQRRDTAARRQRA